MKIRSIILLVIIVTQLLSCKVIFWSDSNTYLNVRWLDGTTAYEPVLHYESKLSWNPLNGNPLTRNYTTEIFLHTVKGKSVTSSPLVEFDGWTLEGSLYQVGDKIFLIRGLNDALATMEDRQILILPNKKSKKSEWITITEKRTILLAIPSPNAKTLGVFTTSATLNSPDSTIYFIRYDLESSPNPKRVSEQKLRWSGVPGVPLAAWDKDSVMMYLFRDRDVLGIGTKNSGLVTKFPECFMATRFLGEISSSGQRLFRYPVESSEFPLKQGTSQKAIPFDSIPMTTKTSKVQAICSE